MPLRALPTAAGRLLDVALPPACSGCGEEGSALCRRCGLALERRLELPPGVPIGLPAAMPMPLAQLEWCAPFAGAVRAALHHLKYSGERRLSAPLGAAMAEIAAGKYDHRVELAATGEMGELVRAFKERAMAFG